MKSRIKRHIKCKMVAGNHRKPPGRFVE